MPNFITSLIHDQLHQWCTQTLLCHADAFVTTDDRKLACSKRSDSGAPPTPPLRCFFFLLTSLSNRKQCQWLKYSLTKTKLYFFKK